MDYLVTMTTHVPDGTSEEAIEGVRSREATRSQELAAQGHLLRLWRPPLRPGEWRTLGLFAAADANQLAEVLGSMPLHIWRHDEVTALLPHPNDPTRPGERPEAPVADPFAREFLTTFTVSVPEDTPREIVDATDRREAARIRELAGQGHLLRLWGLPDGGGELGDWRANGTGEMQAILETLPLYAWMSVETTALSPHPSDPARTSGS
jgi:muconolactone delta-isomerase